MDYTGLNRTQTFYSAHMLWQSELGCGFIKRSAFEEVVSGIFYKKTALLVRTEHLPGPGGLLLLLNPINLSTGPTVNRVQQIQIVCTEIYITERYVVCKGTKPLG